VKTFLFPFTWLPEAHLQAVLRHFRGPVVLAPSDQGVSPQMRQWHEAGRIELVTPVRGDGDRMAGLLKGFRSWAETHRGGDRSIARILEAGVPFFDDSHVARLRSQIRKGESEARGDSLDRLTRARLFLLMAESYDRQSRELEAELDNLETLETAMLSGLRDEESLGEGAVQKAASPTPPDPGRFMTDERIRAWARFYLASGADREMPAVFATTSRIVLETVLDQAAEPETVVSAATEAVGVDAAREAVEALRAGKPVDEAPGSGERRLSLFLLPEVDPQRFFSRFLKAASPPADTPGSGGGTVLAWINTTL
jgi:hypothetical protein